MVIRAAAVPSGHRPRASYVISSLAEKQSCSSITSTSLGFRPAVSKHFLAANLDMSYPTWTYVERCINRIHSVKKTTIFFHHYLFGHHHLTWIMKDRFWSAAVQLFMWLLWKQSCKFSVKKRNPTFLTIFMQLFSLKVEAVSVTISWAKISTAWFSRWWRLTKASLAKTAAPAPSDVGLMSQEEQQVC